MNIETQMRALRLHGMERNWKALNETRRSTELTLSEGLSLLLQAESDERDEKRFERLKQNAGFRRFGQGIDHYAGYRRVHQKRRSDTHQRCYGMWEELPLFSIGPSCLYPRV